MFLALVGFLVFEGGALWAWGQERSVANWTPVPARILKSEEVPGYQAHVVYEYQVGPSIYQSDRVGLVVHRHLSAAAARAIVARYPVGSEVTAYVDPTSPMRVVLEPTSRSNLVGLFVFGGIAWLVVWVLTWRGMGRRYAAR